MKQRTAIALFWAPRALAIAFIAFLSVFALDVFGTGRGFWQTLAAFLLHLIPSFALAAALILAWRWEWIGAAFFAGAAALYTGMVLRHSLPANVKLVWILTIAGPAFVIAALFLVNWLKRSELARHR